MILPATYYGICLSVSINEEGGEPDMGEVTRQQSYKKRLYAIGKRYLYKWMLPGKDLQGDSVFRKL